MSGNNNVYINNNITPVIFSINCSFLICKTKRFNKHLSSPLITQLPTFSSYSHKTACMGSRRVSLTLLLNREFYCNKETSELMTSAIFVSVKCPVVYKTRFLSAVKILFGQIKLSTGREPETKSSRLRGSAKESSLTNHPICHRLSDPVRSEYQSFPTIYIIAICHHLGVWGDRHFFDRDGIWDE